MKIKTLLLPELFETVYRLLTEHGYAQSTQKNYRYTYNQLKIHLEKRKINFFTEEIGMEFIDQHYKRSTSYASLKLRIKRLVEAHENQLLTGHRYIDTKKELVYLEQSFETYKVSQQQRDLSPKTIRHKCFTIKHFFIYLENSGIRELSDIDVQHVYSYLSEKKSFAVSTKESLLYTLRDFLKSFSKTGLCNESLGNLFPQISTRAESPIPSWFTPQEMRTILLSVDRSTRVGKRDYAILLLATFLGIRAGDIRDMKISYIKWGAGIIEFTQSKTKKFLQLPMPNEVKLALLDYLKNARPEVQSDHLFIRFRTPHHEYASGNSFNYIVKKYLGEINLNERKQGLHTLRFSAAGNMLSQGVSIVTICNVLGHSYSDTTNHYLKIDIGQLKKASLEVIE